MPHDARDVSCRFRKGFLLDKSSHWKVLLGGQVGQLVPQRMGKKEYRGRVVHDSLPFLFPAANYYLP